MEKIIEYGMAKTGTTSLGNALKILGYNHASFNEKLHSYYNQNRSNINLENFKSTPIYEYMCNKESFDDGPWHGIDFGILDQTFPNSKFIYLTRDDESWLKSLEYHLSPKYNSHNIQNKDLLDEKWITDRDENIKDLLKQKHHREGLLAFHKNNRPNNFLFMNIKDGWKPLCDFLNKEIPNCDFPRLNVTQY